MARCLKVKLKAFEICTSRGGSPLGPFRLPPRCGIKTGGNVERWERWARTRLTRDDAIIESLIAKIVVRF